MKLPKHIKATLVVSALLCIASTSFAAVAPVPVPEPATGVLLALGIGGAGLYSLWRRKK